MGSVAPDLLSVALQYVAVRGWSVIPVRPSDKRPAVPWEPYQHRHPTDDELERWFGDGTDHNIGIVCGAVSGGLVVLDADGDEGERTFAELKLPRTPRVKTGHGTHAYFRGDALGTGVRVLPGIDVRGEGGYVVAPPSTHESGRGYTWAPGCSPDDVEVAPLPAKLRATAAKAGNGAAGRQRRSVRISDEPIPEGQRNAELTRIGGKLLDNLGHQELATVLDAVNRTRCKPPLDANEVRAIVKSLEGYRPPSESGDDGEDHPEAFLVRAADVRMENATFLWEPYAPCGAVTVAAGIGGLGKSHATIDLAARVSRGQSKGDHHGKPGRVIIATTEDAWAQTVVPRLKAAGADLERVSLVNVERGFVIPDDLPKLEAAIEAEPDTVLIVLDPLIAFIPIRLDAHKDQHARGALSPLARLAHRYQLAIVAVMHLNKAAEAGALFLRVSSSVGFMNAARSAFLVAEDPDDPEHGRILAHGKHNLSEQGESLRFRIEGVTVERDDGEPIETSRLVWLGSSPHGVTDLLKSDHRADPRNAAERFLAELLADGPVPAGKVRSEADKADHAWATVRRAKKDLGVVASKAGMGDGWVWEFPSDGDDPEGNHIPIGGEVSIFGEDEP